VLLDLAFAFPAAVRELARLVPVAASLAVILWTGLRVARPPRVRRLALLAEERLSLQNRLVTTLDLTSGGVLAAAFRRDAERALAGLDARTVVPLRVRSPLIVLLVQLSLWIAFVLLFPHAAAAAWERWLHPKDSYEPVWQEIRSEVLPAPVAPRPVPGFSELRWEIQPPAYTGLPARELRGAEVISVLPGSRIRMSSRFFGEWSAVEASLIGGGGLAVRRLRNEWQVEWVFGGDQRGISLQAIADGERTTQRVVPLVAAPDRPPEVQLMEPEADVIIAAPRGQVPIRAVARDDYGVGNLVLTWIRSRGSGESFSFAEGQWGWGNIARGESGSIVGEYTLDLAGADLQPGDALHIRAVARDRNNITGPGEGVSATRVIRIALPDEQHTVTTLIGYPIEAEKNPVLSQRMLILMTEELRDREPRIGREATLREASEIAHEQGRLRARVGDQVFTRSVGGIQDPATEFGFADEGGGPPHTHEGEVGPHPGADDILERASDATGTGALSEQGHRHDEAPIIDVNRTLVTAYNAMWAAERALGQGEPAAALPHQYEALHLLQEARQGDRVYVRGQSRVPTVDVAEVRGSGKIEEAAPAPRSSAEQTVASQPWLTELERAAAQLRVGAPEAAAADLAALAARLLAERSVDPRAAATVSRAADFARRGETDEARHLLATARSLLVSRSSAGTAAPVPIVTDPVAAEYFRRLGRRP
jgi:hypothetical protein